ncbi:glycosyltransferase [Paraburkholderia lycopersici]|uniref:Glycosyltransferase involved in cell wall bisynthesis n=1 Tax=Paraburkholderia lycopersici TaxID=416944 RepID=A0A1G6XW90_9BURK|nr:glycosyltransferase [Paraburkholderia lycopersici]SDD82439.1 Glycosyltransferase involved in cell wall bisynthesis [Paraburkholderia lycopersici]
MRQNIMHVTEALGGGVLHCIALLANRQVSAGDHVTIVHSIRADTPSEAELDKTLDKRIRRRVVGMKTDIGVHDVASTIALFHEIWKTRPDIIHLHSSKAAALGRVVARSLGMAGRTIYSPHGFSFLKQDISKRKARFYLIIERLLHAMGGNIVACSRSERQYASRLLGHAQRIGLVENAIDTTALTTRKMGVEGRTTTICTSGRVAYQKAPWRFSKLARSISGDKRVGPPPKFVWFGDGDADSVNAWVDRSVVELTGWVTTSDLRQRLAECDLFVLPSLWEGMPIALIEAQALGLPAIGSRVVGNRDVIQHGVTGFLASNDDELAMYVRQLAGDPPLRARMGAAAREKALARFGSERLFRSYVHIYRSLLTAGVPKTRSMAFGKLNRGGVME